MLIFFDERHFLIGVGILVALLPVIWWRKHNLSYLFFFSVFWMYLLAAVQELVFPIYINTDGGTTAFALNVNLIPFYFGDCSMLDFCVRGIVGNTIATIPFGFGVNFLARVKARNFFWLALAVGLAFELSQLAISLVVRNGFRVVDINDVIFNAAGAWLGYALFRAFAWAYVKTSEYFHIKPKWLFADIYEVACGAQAQAIS